MPLPEIAARVRELATRPNLPPFDAQKLADALLVEVEKNIAGLPGGTAGMLMFVAAMLLRHHADAAISDMQAADLVKALRRGG
jgi:hypothetical protein